LSEGGGTFDAVHHPLLPAHAELHELVVEANLVAARLVVSGTHLGDFMGMPPTGRSFTVQHMHMYRVEVGTVAEHWACRDDLGQLAQLGLLSVPGPGDNSGPDTRSPGVAPTG
jgi:hypothetical protein